MQCNVGSTDRLIRIIAGILAIVLGVILKSWWGLIGIVLLATALFRFCPLYIPFNINTVKKEDS